MKRPGLVSYVICGAIAIEALLILRAWMQATARPLDTGATTNLFSITHGLAAPFASLTGEPPRDETGVIDFTILVAIEGYFVGALVLVCLALALGDVGTRLRSRRAASAARLAIGASEAEFGRLIWQPQSSSRLPGCRLYVPVAPAEAKPARAKAALSGTRSRLPSK